MYKKTPPELSDDYLKAAPFPHIVIDDFIENDKFLIEIIENIPKPIFSSSKLNEYKNRSVSIDILNCHKNIIEIFEYFYSDDFLNFLDVLCGKKIIRGLKNILCSDGTLKGAGVHQTSFGGHLNVHTDPPSHHEKKWARPINSILFLTPGWEEKDGGFFQLWDNNAKNVVKEICPKFNRLVIFSNQDFSYHSVNVIASEKIRTSMATFYYTNEMVDDSFCYFPNSSKVYDAIDKIIKFDIEERKVQAEIHFDLLKKEFVDFDKKEFFKRCKLYE